MMMLARKIVERLLFLLTGALAALLYLELTMHESAAEVIQARRVLLLVWFTILYARAFLDSKKESRADTDVSPAFSGTGVVLGTGLAAAYFVTRDSSGSAATLIAAAIGVLTLVIAWFVFRFASNHADEIGEARFVTTNPDAAKNGDA